jgi:hypothetical protein
MYCCTHIHNTCTSIYGVHVYGIPPSPIMDKWKQQMEEGRESTEKE